MPRQSRQKSSINVYHVVIKGADRQLLFEEPKDFEKYLEFLELYREKCGFELYAYCLMSNHVHLLIHPSETCSLSNIFQRLNTAYALWFNGKYQRTGFLQNNRFYSKPIEDIDYLFNTIKYIHWNPAEAGLEVCPGASYIWSSYHEYTNTPFLINTHYVLNLFGGEEAFLTFHDLHPEEKCFDVDQLRSRIPDDVAKQIIFDISGCQTVTDFQNLSLIMRNKSITEIMQKGVSIRQLNRLTGTPRGIILSILHEKTSLHHKIS